MVRTRRQTTHYHLSHQSPPRSSKSTGVSKTRSMATNTYKPMKTMDERLLKKPKSAIIETTDMQSSQPSPDHQAVPSTSQGIQSTSNNTTKHPYASGKYVGHDDGKLDIIIGTLTSLQDSVRELHNEFAAIKPRVSQFKTSSTGSTMLVKSSVTDNPTDVYKCIVAKRKKRLEQ